MRNRILGKPFIIILFIILIGLGNVGGRIIFDFDNIQEEVREDGLLSGLYPYILDIIIMCIAIIIATWLLVFISRLERTEEELREAKEKYQMLVENLYEGVLLEDIEGRITFVNPRLVDMTGHTEVELIGESKSIITPLEEMDKIEKERSKRLEGISSTYLTTLMTKDGRKIPVINSATPVFVNGAFRSVLTVITDITEHIQIEEQLSDVQEKYEMLVENLYEGIILEDTEGIITFVNPRLAVMVGYLREELIGQRERIIIPYEELQKIEKENIKRSHGVSSTYMSALLRKDGKRVPVIISATPLFTKEVFQGTLTVITDITEHLRMEEELKKYRSLLEKTQEESS